MKRQLLVGLLNGGYNKVEGRGRRIKATEKKIGVLAGHMIKTAGEGD